MNWSGIQILKIETASFSHPVIQPGENPSWTHGQSWKYVDQSFLFYAYCLLKSEIPFVIAIKAVAYCQWFTFCILIIVWRQILTWCVWISVPGESDEELRDNRPSIEFSDLDDDLEEY